ncbi:MAG: tol-pal system-associated acyl-CoA thioesterase [Beggiatoa sp. IS2]|nr:MAG: tol-pal system-associated acyl-CoA thioesterase [Beggiatoa sp. IS2]
MNEFRWPVRVYYEDTDIAGIVYHANYLKFMERARTEWLRHLGLEQTQIRQQYQSIFVIRQVNIDYLKPARFNDELQITVRLTRLGRASMMLQQNIGRGPEVLCTATVKIACVHGVSLRPQPFHEELFEILSQL